MGASLDVHFSSGKDDWQTPPEVFDPLNDEFGFVVDLAATEITKRLDPYLGPDQPLEEYQDSLTAPWAEWFGEGPGYLNPPYLRGSQGLFIHKAARERKLGFTTVMLLPARPDTVAFHAYIHDRMTNTWREGVEVRFLKGRIKFVGAKHGAPFPSMVVVFRA